MSNILVPLVLLLRPVDAELEFVLGLWSAGEAGPKTLPYPNDKNLLSQWTRGGGRLTEIGMRRMFDLGRWLRQRYIVDRQFLTSDYNPNEVLSFLTLVGVHTLQLEKSLAVELLPPCFKYLITAVFSFCFLFRVLLPLPLEEGT
ncbi:unnamed protein product [Heligmosomoides polygyrus]|uniref:Secreted protein n=1 Tax=Heligmosomoides polygyrus TaxID=6339 RepID=A0A183FVR2_HELPZ|nr:unnamed protein product [Heligmosomoides polygyrus]